MVENVATKEEKAKFSLSSIATLFGILAPIFYVFGYLSDQGYLNTYGINNEYFPRELQFYLLKFFDILIQMISGLIVLSIKYFWFPVLYIFALSVFAFFITTRASDKIVKKIDGAKDKVKSNKNIFNALMSAGLFVAGVAMLVLIVILYF